MSAMSEYVRTMRSLGWCLVLGVLLAGVVVDHVTSWRVIG